jgi:hypothetical protein
MIYHKAVMIGSVTQSTNLKISEENEIDRVELRLDCSGGIISMGRDGIHFSSEFAHYSIPITLCQR